MARTYFPEARTVALTLELLLLLFFQDVSAYYQYNLPIGWEDKPPTTLVNSPVSRNNECRSFKPKRVVQPTSYEASTIYNVQNSFVTNVVAFYRDFQCKGTKGPVPAMLLVLDPNNSLGVNIVDFKKLRFFAQIHSTQSVDIALFDQIIQRLTGDSIQPNRVYHWTSNGAFAGTSDADGLIQNFQMEDIATPEELDMVASENTRDIEIVLGRVTNRVLAGDPERQAKIELLEAIAPQLLRPVPPRMALRPAAPRQTDTASANRPVESAAPVVPGDTASRTSASTAGLTPEQIANWPVDIAGLVMQFVEAPDPQNWFKTIVAEAYQAQKRMRAAYEVLQSAAQIMRSGGVDPQVLMEQLSQFGGQFANDGREGLQENIDRGQVPDTVLELPQYRQPAQVAANLEAQNGGNANEGAEIEEIRYEVPGEQTQLSQQEFLWGQQAQQSDSMPLGDLSFIQDFDFTDFELPQFGSQGAQNLISNNLNGFESLNGQDLNMNALISDPFDKALLASLRLPGLESMEGKEWTEDPATPRSWPPGPINVSPEMGNWFAGEAVPVVQRERSRAFAREGVDGDDFDIDEYFQSGRKQLKVD
ncbi:hypothetical protein TWF696_006705 [Orbilia brochopaga]|uniref:Uncharacterized protein n=1 Tax=Orbilia brochopaga TaxID=3140254 RepID=A0AAV9UPN1_9PEZI